MTNGTPSIRGFFGTHRVFSNFYRRPILFMGHIFPSVENAFQWYKGVGMDNDPVVMERFYTDVSVQEDGKSKILKCYTPSQAKRVGRELKLRPDWDVIREPAMLLLETTKFTSDEELKKVLLDTGDAYLEETNYWHDNFWGNCNGPQEYGCYKEACQAQGLNKLGEILMSVRTKLKEAQNQTTG